ncbi:hypothetical protein [Tenacibaculum sp. Ill]|uniref:hypothetical protein n=1 Tax=Tenacibaculum sp. Ill TaxID=3445935 RepID=UPI003F7ABDDB
MKYLMLLFCVTLLTINCKTKLNNNPVQKNKEEGVIKQKKDTVYSLLDTINFERVVKSISNVELSQPQKSDWLTNNDRFLSLTSINLEMYTYKVKTKSYKYRDSVTFYIHNLKHKDNTLSMKPYLENLRGEKTRGYLGDRILIFAMRNNKEVNFIDIPEKMNPYKLRLELVDTLYKRIKSDVIICDRWNKCVYKDFREKK